MVWCSGFQVPLFTDQTMECRAWVSVLGAEIRGSRRAYRSGERVDDCRRNVHGCYVIRGRNIELRVRARLAQAVVDVLKTDIPRLKCSTPRRRAVVEVIEIGAHLHRDKKRSANVHPHTNSSDCC
jgi:hypothetical protein